MDFKTIVKEHSKLIITIGLVGIFILSLFLYPNKNIHNANQTIKNTTFDYALALQNIEAKSFYVYDIQNDKVLFEKEPHMRLPLASIAKLMSGLVVINILPETTDITIHMDDILAEGDSGLNLGERWKLKNLLDFSLITSSNDGIHAIASTFNDFTAEKNLITLMNAKAKELSLEDTVFVNETGLDIDEFMSGAYSSAYDVSVLLTNILKNNPVLLSGTNKTNQTFTSLNNLAHKAINTNIAIDQIPNLIASKTGFTDLAGGNLAIIFDAGISDPIVIVVLGSSEKGRFTDVVLLTQLALQKLSE